MKLTDFAALTFDCYGTLIDWESGILGFLRAWAARHGVEANDEALLEAVGEAEARHEKVRPAFVYSEVLRRVHGDVAERFGVPRDAGEEQAYADSVRDWPAFEDTVEGLTHLKRFYKLAILSNVDHRSFAFSRPKLGVELDVLVTAEDVGAYKPDRPHFDRALEILRGMDIERRHVLHVAQSLYHDIGIASSLGLRTVWIDRYHKKRSTGAVPAAEAKPDLRVTSLAELVLLHRKQLAST